MEEQIQDLEEGLNRQLQQLTEQIRTAEANLMTLKEGYLKVLGAIELLEVVKKKQDEQNLALAEV